MPEGLTAVIAVETLISRRFAHSALVLTASSLSSVSQVLRTPLSLLPDKVG